MSVADNLRKQAEELKEKAGELTARHNEQIDHAVDVAGETLDKATGHRYSEKIEKAAARAKHAVDEFAHRPPEEGTAGGTGGGSGA